MRKYFVVATPGSMKLTRRGQVPGGDPVRPGSATGRAGRPITEFSAKARRQMRWVWSSLPWDDLERLAMLTLTYPADWRSACPDSKTLKGHLRAFRMRWERKWGPVRGVWVLEFQPRRHRPVEERQAPHFHLYVDIPEGAVIEEDPTDRRLVWDWARQVWWEIVGSGDRRHRYWGVHYRPCFYGRFGNGQANGKKVGDYLWRESGKLAQRDAPEGFAGVKWWSVWRMEPIEVEQEVSRNEFVRIRRPVRRKRDEVAGVKVRARSARTGRIVTRRQELAVDGVTVTNLDDGIGFAAALLRWAGS